MITAGAEHPIRVHLCPQTREPRPYVLVREGLEAKINRAVFYELCALAEPEMVDGREMLGVWSEGVFFPIDEVAAMDAAALQARHLGGAHIKGVGAAAEGAGAAAALAVGLQQHHL
jgi:hypothetical protein